MTASFCRHWGRLRLFAKLHWTFFGSVLCFNTMAMGPSAEVASVRLGSIAGHEERVNDVILSWGKTPAACNMVFFGGDVQDYTENMLAHRDNKRYEMWNLERTARLLQARFPDSHVWIVKPTRMHLKTFSVFSNFVESTDIGVPTHYDNQGSWLHLKKLLENSVAKANSEFNVNSCIAGDNVQCSTSEDRFSTHLPLRLIGFSKGCVVLNQFLYELETAKKDEGLFKFVKQVERMYWLDGGHNGGSNTWIVHEDVLSSLVGTGITVHAHVTPYQVKDVMRKWIGKEQKKFVEKLKELGVDVKSHFHFGEMERSIENHFQVLEVF